MNESMISATLQGLKSFFQVGSIGVGSKRKRDPYEEQEALKNNSSNNGLLYEELLVPNPLLASSANPSVTVVGAPSVAPVVVVSAPAQGGPPVMIVQQQQAMSVPLQLQGLGGVPLPLSIQQQLQKQQQSPITPTSTTKPSLAMPMATPNLQHQYPPSKKARTVTSPVTSSSSPSPYTTFKLPVGVGIKVPVPLPVLAPSQAPLGTGSPNPTATSPVASSADSAKKMMVNVGQPILPVLCASSNGTNPRQGGGHGGALKASATARATTAASARKERNRQAAKQSRIRKKNEEDFLKLELEKLQQENVSLRKLIKVELKDEAAEIIGQDCYSLAANSKEEQGQAQGQPHQHLIPQAGSTTNTTTMGYNDFELIESLTKEGEAFVLTDPRLPDNPIVYASPKFFQLTQYAKEQVIGRNCRFLQGPQTCPEATQRIRNAIETGSDCTVRLLNFKQDGTPFWNHFFLAALRDKNSKIVNYVGVQTAMTAPTPEELEQMTKATATKAAATARPTQVLGQQEPEPESKLETPKQPSASASVTFQERSQMQQSHTNSSLPTPTEATAISTTTTTGAYEDSGLDWAELAKSLEADFFHDDDNNDDDNLMDQDTDDIMDLDFDFEGSDNHIGFNSNDDDDDDQFVAPFQEEEEIGITSESPNDNICGGATESATNRITTTATPAATLQLQPPLPSSPSSFPPPPRWLVTQTVKSDLVDALMVSHGDTTTERFARALDLLAAIHRSNNQNATTNESLSPLLHGDNWRSLSRPSYSGCLGQTDNGDFVYTLGKMSFNMFKPGNLRCTVQRSMTMIQPVCEMDQSPRAAPFSLRRELADATAAADGYGPANAMLKSYDISVALTIESNDFFKSDPKETIPAPPCRLRALQVVNGFYLPDPSTPNRLTVWFTGGKLKPVVATTPSSSSPSSSLQEEENHFGGLEEWKELFGGEHKRTWTEVMSNIGAQVFLGAELPKGMEPDGSMSYTLHRPYGGHGKGFVDILYLDDNLLITKGNYGTIHVMASSM